MSLTAKDLQPFANLVSFDLHDNKITSLDGDLFNFTPNSIYANFMFNQIQHIGDDLVTTLNNLEYLFMPE